MPAHIPGETRNEWMARCVPYVIKNEGLKQDQAVGKCSGMFDSHSAKAIADDPANPKEAHSQILSSAPGGTPGVTIERRYPGEIDFNIG